MRCSKSQELAAAVEQLPPPGHQARQLHRPGGEAHLPPPGSPRQQVRGDFGAGRRVVSLVVHRLARLC
jgi:hypothetical protein